MVQMTNAAFVDTVRDFMGGTSRSLNTVAKSAGISSATLSMFLSGKYQGDTDKVQAKLAAVMSREREKKELPVSVKGFIPTSVSRQVFEVAQVCRALGEIGVCYSAAGLGKTESVREYANKNLDVILIEADPGYTAKVLFSKIGKAVGCAPRSNLHDIFEDCCERLKDSGRLLIIDEAEQLPFKALEMLRRLHDNTGIGVLLTGMPKLIANLRGNRGEYAQLYSRVGMVLKIKSITMEDTAALLEKLLPDSSGEVCKVFHTEAGANTRRLFKLVTHTKRIAKVNNRAVDVNLIHTAARFVKVEVMS